MKRLLLLLAATALTAAPAVAQHHGHHMAAPAKKAPAKKAPAKKAPAKKAAATKKPAAKKPAPKKANKPASKKASPKKPPAKKAPAKQAPAKAAADPHAGHDMPSPAQDPHAGHQMTPAQPSADPHAGHQMPVQQGSAADAHAGHDMSTTAAAPPVAPRPAAALQGPENAADAAWSRNAMEGSRAEMFREHGDMPAYKILVDQMEARLRDGRDGYSLDAEGWYGGDIDKFWLKTEIEGDSGSKPEQAEFQALWSHAIDPWFDVQAGVRLDVEPEARGHLVLGVQGLAPYWIEVDAAVFVSDRGDITARAEAEHDVRITRKLILQPRVEFDLALQDIERRSVGSGLSTAELGLRLRYEIAPNFAPYVGLHYERAFGDTRRFRRLEGDDLGGLSFLVGLRTWF